MAARKAPLFANWTIRKQIAVSWSMIGSVACIHSLIPQARGYTQRLYQLPYPIQNGWYLQGADDALFVLGWLVLITAIRAIIIKGLHSFVKYCRLVPSKARMRFAEQGFLLLYYGTSFTVGLRLMMDSSYWLNFEELWSTWPSRKITGNLKLYYLIQLSFYLQQILAVNLEKRRKDYKQMFIHHIVTSALMYIAYAYRWTKVGNVVLVIMDVVDYLLPLAKLLKYMGFEKACNTMFVVFLATWLIARHGIYNFLTWSIYRDVPRVMPFGCYASATETLETDPIKLGSRWRYADPFFDQNGTICLDKNVKSVFLGLLLMLQGLSIVWFIMIVKVALKILKGEEAQDTRSSDEEDDEMEDEEEIQHSKDATLYQEKAMNRKAAYSHSGKCQASGSEPPPPRQTGIFQRGTGRIRVPGSRDRKELIGRVGCNG